MSRPVLSSATRRLPRYCAHSPVIIARSHRLISTTQPVLSISKLHDRGLPSAQPEANVLSASRQVRSHRNRFLRPSASPFAAPRQQVAFASTLAKVVLNSRTDDDGNVLTVDISERAAERLRKISESPSPTAGEHPYDHLRITVTSGGCHGFQYILSLEPASKVDPEEDTVFEAKDDTAPGHGTAKVAMDFPTLELLSGSVIDFTTELIGSQFKVQNPRATSSCGCGTSFDVNE